MGKLYHLMLTDVVAPFMPTTPDGILNHAIDWIQYGTDCYLIYDNRSANDWHAIIKKNMTSQGRFFICELNLDNRAGWMHNNIWRWIERAKTLENYQPGDIVFYWYENKPDEVRKGTVTSIAEDGRPRIKLPGAPITFNAGPIRVSKLHPKTKDFEGPIDPLQDLLQHKY